MWPAILVLVLEVTCFVSASSAEVVAAETTPPDIILIVVDTLRADYLGAYGFVGPISPQIDRFAAEAVRFERCVSTAPWTKPSTASMMTSLMPGTHRVLDHQGQYASDVPSGLKTSALPEEAETLAEALRGFGFQTAGWSANSWITKAMGFAQGFDVFHDPSQNLLNSDEVLRPALDWIDHASGKRPFFLYLHLMDVHGPWRWNPTEWSLLRPSPGLGWDRILSPEDVAQGKSLVRLIGISGMGDRLGEWRATYAAGVRVLDGRLGRFLDELRASGQLDRSLVVITADHGEELFDHGGWGHGWTLHGDQTWVPLLVRLPGGIRGGGVVYGTVSLLDIMPTLLEAAGVPLGKRLQGRSLWRRLSTEGSGEEKRRWVFAQGVKDNDGLVSVENGRIKLIRQYPDGIVGLFDQVADRAELRNLAQERPETRRFLEQQLEKWTRSLRNIPTLLTKSAVLSEEEVERLRSLGYLDAH